MFNDFRLGISTSVMTKIVKASAHLIAQKRQISQMAKTAASLVTASEELLTSVRSEVVEVEVVKKDILQCQADIGGSIVRMKELDQWIQREIEKDPVTASDNALVASHTATLKEFANAERNYETLIKKLKYHWKELTELIEQQDKWEAMPPTRRGSLELVDSRWEVSDDEDNVFESDTEDKIKEDSKIRMIREFAKAEVARQLKSRMSTSSMSANMSQEKLRAELEECRARLAKFESEKTGSKEKGFSRKEATVKETVKDNAIPKIEKTRNEKNKASEEKLFSDQDSTDSNCSNSDESEYQSARMTEFGTEIEEEKEKVSGYKSQKKYLRLKLNDLPKFDGNDPSEYEEFKTMFMEGYDKNPDLSKVMKLIQLKSSLSGLAKELLAGLQLIGQNYKVAWQILDQNYLKNVRPMEELQKKFNRLAIHKTDYKEMKKDMSKITAVVYDMQNRGLDVNMPHIYQTIISKFPSAIAEELIVKTLSSRFEGEFSKIQKWVDKLLSAKISVAEMRAPKNKKSQDFELGDQVDYLEGESEEESDFEGEGTSGSESH